MAAAQADADIFALVFERPFAAVHRYAQQRVGRDAADEIASETFLVAFDPTVQSNTARPAKSK